jgi:hypothetical protein
MSQLLTIAAIAFLGLTSAANAQPRTLDPNFGARVAGETETPITWRAALTLSKDGGAACGSDITCRYTIYTIVIKGVHLVATPDDRKNFPVQRGNLTTLKVLES